MLDYQLVRNNMLDSQIRVNDVNDRRIVAAFRKTPREKFVPKAKLALAYADVNIPTDDGRVMMRPRDLAKMVDAAELEPSDIVLVIAGGRGYAVAVMADIAETVIALEDDADRVTQATNRLDKCEITNAAVVEGALQGGALDHGPYNVIFVNGAVADIPKAWFDQLAEGGRLVVPVQAGPLTPVRVYTKSSDTVSDRYAFDATLPVIAGFEAKPEFSL